MAEVPEITPGYETSNARKCLYFGVGIVCLSHRSFNKKKGFKTRSCGRDFLFDFVFKCSICIGAFWAFEDRSNKKGLIWLSGSIKTRTDAVGGFVCPTTVCLCMYKLLHTQSISIAVSRGSVHLCDLCNCAFRRGRGLVDFRSIQ